VFVFFLFFLSLQTNRPVLVEGCVCVRCAVACNYHGVGKLLMTGSCVVVVFQPKEKVEVSLFFSEMATTAASLHLIIRPRAEPTTTNG
jgi:hypothetical protein